MDDQIDVTIRRATTADAAVVARIHTSSWRQAYTGIIPDEYLGSISEETRTRRWTDILSSPESVTWLALLGDRTVGFASIGPARDEDAEDGDLELQYIYLEPETWGHGVARHLMREVLAAVPERTPLSLWVLADNERARHFYRRHGFAADGVEKLEEYAGETLTEVRYRRG